MRILWFTLVVELFFQPEDLNMPKMPKPWYRKSKGAWFICLGGKQILLAKGKANKAEAEKRYHEIMLLQSAGAEPESSQTTVASLCEAYLAWCHRHRRKSTYEWYLFFLQDFAENRGRNRVCDLKPYHITRWVDSHNWNDSSVRCAITCIKRVLNWAVDEGLIASHALRNVKKPKACSRKRVLSDAEVHALIADSDEHFADFLKALRGTGARPVELRELLWSQVELEQGICVLHEHKTSTQQDEPRILILTTEMQALFARRKAKYPNSDHVFLNRFGKPWTRNAVGLRMKRLRDRLGLDPKVVAYTVRHTFGTRALLNGVDLKTLSQLMGHSSVSTTETYLHLAHETEHLKTAMNKATRKKS